MKTYSSSSTTKLVFCILMAVVFFLTSNAHDINSADISFREWNVKGNQTIQASFLMYKNGEVYLEKQDGATVHFPLTKLSENDRTFVQQRNAHIAQLNQQLATTKGPSPIFHPFFDIKFWIVFVFLFFFGVFIYMNTERKQFKYLYPVLFVGASAFLYGFAENAARNILTTTDPNYVDSAFTPFKPNVITHWDANYFYVESYGIPTTHEMMVGISDHGWQQQVPIPQCYTGSNAWQIPLNPTMATNPIPVDTIHFTRGAIALATNGIPIFNVHTNTGVDSYIDGQLDNYGGHCGRADDYHYHIAPLHLYDYNNSTRPIAYGLDGFAVYGSVEPDGTAMQTLDANHGHAYGGIYHYHGTVTAPYMIANMAGQVTEDATHQLIPQAAAHPVRTENWTPLKGALITACTPKPAKNGYDLSYTLNGIAGYATNFSWSGTTYTFDYVTPTGTTSKNYNGFVQCYHPTAIDELTKLFTNFGVYPNPSSSEFYLSFDDKVKQSDIKNVTVFGLNGDVVYRAASYNGKIYLGNVARGEYFVKVEFTDGTASKKIILQ